ncbi:MAG: hypothetical protein ACYC58_07315 [Pseudomonadaceae bacterium]
MNNGIDEQEQNGVTVPSSAPVRLAKAAHATENAPRALRREITLDPGDTEDQHRQQDEDLDHVIDEEMQTAADPAGHIQTEHVLDQQPHQIRQPVHAQQLVVQPLEDFHESFLICAARRVRTRRDCC